MPAILESPSAVWIIHIDGTALPNPGRIGLGAVLVAPDGTRHCIAQLSQPNGCNNEAEARALILALDTARQLGARQLRIHSDSDVLVQHLNGKAITGIVRLNVLFGTLRQQMAAFESTELCWLPRHRNAEADALARGVLGLAPKAAKKPLRRRS